MKDRILDIVINNYVNSSDFNGILLKGISETIDVELDELIECVSQLVQEECISLTFESIFMNPFIKAFDDLPKEEQVKKLFSEKDTFICLYPTKQALTDISLPDKYNGCPFSIELFNGASQFKPIYFDYNVLEIYYNDPRYIISHSDYSGNISIEDGYYDEMTDDEHFSLQTFGIAHDDNGIRYIIVYLRYLKQLTKAQQIQWNMKRTKKDCRQNRDYLLNTLGYWVENISMFKAFIMEEYHINRICELMGRPLLFREEFMNNRPDNFTAIIRPTLKNYFDFVLTLDKMISDNINKKFFCNDIELTEEKEIEYGKFQVLNKGTLRLLEEWIKKYFKPKDPKPTLDMFSTFKRIRKERQKPAHKINTNLYDVEYFKKQNKLIIEAYTAMRTLRLIFINHPNATGYKIPKELYEGKVVLY